MQNSTEKVVKNPRTKDGPLFICIYWFIIGKSVEFYKKID